MRVISGLAGGHRLKAPKGSHTRPTEDRIKENVFNLLGQFFAGGVVLDLFAGSGGNGIEFLSRGCDFCYFVDSAKEAVTVIRENLVHTHLLHQAEILPIRFQQALDHFEADFFDYIYMDPPFQMEKYYQDSFKTITNKNLLKSGGFFIVEHDKEKNFEVLPGFEEFRIKNYGNTSITIWRKL